MKLVKFQYGAAGSKFNVVKFENSGIPPCQISLDLGSSNLNTVVQGCWI